MVILCPRAAPANANNSQKGSARDQKLMKLLSPCQIGPMQLKNRIVMAPMTTNYGHEDQTPSPRLRDYLLERARGGVGLITVEVCTVDVLQKYQPGSLTLGADEFIEPHRKLVAAIHASGAKVQPQITHPGPESLTGLYFGGEAIGPSHGVGGSHGLPCREVTLAELDIIVEQYAAASHRAQLAGYDGIELHAAHAYMLLGSFLSPLKNKRQDEFGAQTPENRTRLLVRVLRAIREKVGKDFPITLRISGFERVPGGRDATDTAAIAPLLVEAGVSAFHISGGISDPMVSQMICGPDTPDGYNLPEAAAVKRVVDVPVMVVGRFHDPAFAEQALQNDQADMIVMGRPLVADPELPNKLNQNRAAEIRRCVSCQTCIDSMFQASITECAVNARSGREAALPCEPVKHVKHVVVIGAGAGGMEAARVCAERGHRVTLLERRKRLGGSLLLAATVHSDNGKQLEFLRTQVSKLPVDVRLGFVATPESVAALAPDEVIVATGARLEYPEIAIDEGSPVWTGGMLRQLTNGELQGDEQGGDLPGWIRLGVSVGGGLIDRHLTPERLRRAADRYLPFGKKVVIVGGDLAVIELAEFLARRRHEVIVLAAGDQLAPEIGGKRRLEHEKRLEQLQVSLNTGIQVLAIDGNTLRYRSNGIERSLSADSFLIAGEPVADTRLHEQMIAAGMRSHVIGDATGLGLIHKATLDAVTVANSL